MEINKKRKAVATIEKFEIIKSLESGIKKHCDLAKEYGISENTVYKNIFYLYTSLSKKSYRLIFNETKLL